MRNLKKVLVSIAACAMMIGAMTTVHAEESPKVKDISKFAVETTSYTYDGASHTTVITVTDPDTGVALKQGVDFVPYWGQTHTGASTFTVKVRGKGAYTGSTQGTWVIYRCPIANASATAANKVYNGETQSTSLTVTYNGMTLKEGKDYVISKGGSSKIVGNKTVVIRGIGNFTSNKGVNWKITKCPISKIKDNIKLEVKKTAAGYSYPKVVSAKGLAGEKVIAKIVPSVTEIKTKKKGTYTVEVQCSSTGSYTGTVTLNWTVK